MFFAAFCSSALEQRKLEKCVPQLDDDDDDAFDRDVKDRVRRCAFVGSMRKVAHALGQELGSPDAGRLAETRVPGRSGPVIITDSVLKAMQVYVDVLHVDIGKPELRTLKEQGERRREEEISVIAADFLRGGPLTPLTARLALEEPESCSVAVVRSEVELCRKKLETKLKCMVAEEFFSPQVYVLPYEALAGATTLAYMVGMELSKWFPVVIVRKSNCDKDDAINLLNQWFSDLEIHLESLASISGLPVLVIAEHAYMSCDRAQRIIWKNRRRPMKVLFWLLRLHEGGEPRSTRLMTEFDVLRAKLSGRDCAGFEALFKRRGEFTEVSRGNRSKVDRIVHWGLLAFGKKYELTMHYLKEAVGRASSEQRAFLRRAAVIFNCNLNLDSALALRLFPGHSRRACSPSGVLSELGYPVSELMIARDAPDYGVPASKGYCGTRLGGTSDSPFVAFMLADGPDAAELSLAFAEEDVKRSGEHSTIDPETIRKNLVGERAVECFDALFGSQVGRSLEFGGYAAAAAKWLEQQLFTSVGQSRDEGLGRLHEGISGARFSPFILLVKDLLGNDAARNHLERASKLCGGGFVRLALAHFVAEEFGCVEEALKLCEKALSEVQEDGTRSAATQMGDLASRALERWVKGGVEESRLFDLAMTGVAAYETGYTGSVFNPFAVLGNAAIRLRVCETMRCRTWVISDSARETPARLWWDNCDEEVVKLLDFAEETLETSFEAARWQLQTAMDRLLHLRIRLLMLQAGGNDLPDVRDLVTQQATSVGLSLVPTCVRLSNERVGPSDGPSLRSWSSLDARELEEILRALFSQVYEGPGGAMYDSGLRCDFGNFLHAAVYYAGLPGEQWTRKTRERHCILSKAIDVAQNWATLYPKDPRARAFQAVFRFALGIEKYAGSDLRMVPKEMRDAMMFADDAAVLEKRKYCGAWLWLRRQSSLALAPSHMGLVRLLPEKLRKRRSYGLDMLEQLPARLVDDGRKVELESLGNLKIDVSVGHGHFEFGGERVAFGMRRGEPNVNVVVRFMASGRPVAHAVVPKDQQ